MEWKLVFDLILNSSVKNIIKDKHYMIELNNLARNFFIYSCNQISSKCDKESVKSFEIQRCYFRGQASFVSAVGRQTSSRTFPLPVSRCEHQCDIHQRVINQSADILVPVRICGPAFKDHRASVIPWSARYPLSSNAVSIQPRTSPLEHHEWV